MLLPTASRCLSTLGRGHIVSAARYSLFYKSKFSDGAQPNFSRCFHTTWQPDWVLYVPQNYEANTSHFWSPFTQTCAHTRTHNNKIVSHFRWTWVSRLALDTSSPCRPYFWTLGTGPNASYFPWHSLRTTVLSCCIAIQCLTALALAIFQLLIYLLLRALGRNRIASPGFGHCNALF